uniref:Uncharacterized protein n=1 Tax=Acrobeloides nanus TaxID=290746 RepID=A0A914DUX8_9BILA
MVRLKFAKEHKDWTVQQWARILWSDESKKNMFGSDDIKFMRRPAGKCFDLKYQLPTVKHSKSVMVKEEWNRIPVDILKVLVKSIPCRINAVIKAKGYPTKY